MSNRMSPPPTRVIFCCIAAVSLLTNAFAQVRTSNASSVKSVVSTLRATRRIKQVAISPDGSQVASVVSSGKGKNAVYLTHKHTGGAVSVNRITAGCESSCDEQAIAFSRDGKQLAFLSDAEKNGQLQLYVANSTTNSVRKLTGLTGYLADPQWSRDGKQLAILFTENAPRVAGPLEPMTPDSGVVGGKIYEQRLTTIDLATGKANQISPADLYVYEYDWSPDGKTFAAIAAPGSGDNNWYIAQLYTLASSGGAMRSIYKPDLQIAIPRWSPEGRSIAFIGGIMSDEGSIGGDIFTIPASGGQPRNATPGIAASPSWLQWSDESQILFGENVDGLSG